MALCWELLMALAMLESLDGPSLRDFHGTCYAYELGWPFFGCFSWPLLNLKAWMALRWELLKALVFWSLRVLRLELFITLAMLGSLDGRSLRAF